MSNHFSQHVRKNGSALEKLEPVLDEGGPLATRQLGITDAQAQELIKELL